jgi:quinol-cytochrome oxidoreductase complex cytochrome b subunit
MNYFRLVVNWVALLLFPIWGLPFVLVEIIKDFTDTKVVNSSFRRSFRTGERWFWQ